jgi:hypothetical protein
MGKVILKACVFWVLLLALAILNAVAREKLFVQWFGPQLAQMLSGVSLSVLIFLATLLSVNWLGLRTVGQCWLVGMMWLVMTVLFEFLFGHYFAGHSWEALLQAYRFPLENLWLLVLLVILVSPCLAARLRRLSMS